MAAWATRALYAPPVLHSKLRCFQTKHGVGLRTPVAAVPPLWRNHLLRLCMEMCRPFKLILHHRLVSARLVVESEATRHGLLAEVEFDVGPAPCC